MAKILVVEDDDDLRVSVKEILQENAYEVVEAANVEAARRALDTNPFDIALIDMRMPPSEHTQSVDGKAGLKIIEYAVHHSLRPICIVMTAYGSAENLVEAIQKGAWDYIDKPFPEDRLLSCIDSALKQREFEQSCPRVVDYQRERLMGQSPKMIACLNRISRIAQAHADVLILGESGTGKELVARAIHYDSARRHRNFIPLNCANIPGELLESELFGHKKGAFSGATDNRPGAFVTAEGGTIFLDEIGDMPLNMQAKLLRVLQERKIKPLGEDRELNVNVRVISATNKNLEHAVKEGTFREDLYFRLNVVSIEIPPLRERKEDIPLLVAHFLVKHSQNAPLKSISDEAMGLLCQDDWRGSNVRGLENMIRRAMIFAEGPVIQPSDFQLPEPVRRECRTSRWPDEPEKALVESLKRLVELGNTWNMIEDYLIAVAMSEKDVDEEAANVIGKPATTLRSKKQTMKRSVQVYLEKQGKSQTEIQELDRQLGDLKNREQRQKLVEAFPLYTESRRGQRNP